MALGVGRSALPQPLDPLLTQRNVTIKQTHCAASDLSRDNPPYKQDVAGSKPASGITTIRSTCWRQLFSMPVKEASTRSRFSP